MSGDDYYVTIGGKCFNNASDAAHYLERELSSVNRDLDKTNEIVLEVMRERDSITAERDDLISERIAFAEDDQAKLDVATKEAAALRASVAELTDQLARFQQRDGACAYVRLEEAEQRNANLSAALIDIRYNPFLSAIGMRTLANDTLASVQTPNPQS